MSWLVKIRAARTKARDHDMLDCLDELERLKIELVDSRVDNVDMLQSIVDSAEKRRASQRDWLRKKRARALIVETIAEPGKKAGA